MTSPGRSLLGLGRLSLGAAGGGLVVALFVARGPSIVAEAPVLVGAVGISALLVAASAGTRWAVSGAWTALAVSGQAAALQMIRAGTSVGYQHLAVPSATGSRADLLSVAVLVLQALAVAKLAIRNRRVVVDRLVGDLGGWRLALVGAGFVLTAATLSPSVPVYVTELALAAALQLVNVATVGAAIVALPSDGLAPVTRWLGRGADGERHGGRRDLVLPLGAAAWIAGVALLLAVAAYERHPHIADEVVYLLHARYLAEGRLWLPVPPVPEAFELDLMHMEGGRWYSPVPPGWPALLALGVKLGTPWLVNPLLAAVSVLLAHRLLSDLYDRETARIGTLLLAASPWFVFLSMSTMNHTALTAAALAGAVAVARLQSTGRLAWAVAAGLAVALVAGTRPLDGAIAGLVLGGWTLAVRGDRWRLSPSAVFALSVLVFLVPLLAYNHYFTGDPLVFPIMEYTEARYGAGSNALGFGPDRGLGWGGFDPYPGHDLFDALINSNLNAFALNVELFGWSTGSLLPVLLLATSRRLRWPDLAMLGVVLLVVIVYATYWSSGGPDFGPRYWSLVLVPCVALTARAVPIVGRLLRPGGDERSGGERSPSDGVEAPSRASARGTAALGLVCLAATTTFVPWRAVDKYHRYRGMRPDVRTLARVHDFGEVLVLVDGERWPDYASAAAYNPLDLRAPAPVYAWDRSPDVRQAVLAAYPDRDVWFVRGPSSTGDGFRVVSRVPRRAGEP